MRIAFDFADPDQATKFPSHGWARNSQGVKVLWLPVLRLVHQAPIIRKANGVSDDLSPGQWSEIRAFVEAIRRLVLILRELHKCVRIGSALGFDEQDQEKWNASQEASLLIPLFVDQAFVYTRRIADHFARASRYALFKNPGSAPREYKKLRLFVADKAKLQRLSPICDLDCLQGAFANHSGWLDKLRDSIDESGGTQKGIRDIIEHHPTHVTVSHHKVGDDPWEVIASLGEPGVNSSFRTDLLPTLKDIIAGLSCLWTEVCIVTGLPKAECQWVAPYGDGVLLTGNDDDYTGFWPEIKS
ncbi:hypothetical protein [Coleofasciculus sp. FACHB-T130]|uniref:hypothetical protein n=1 Tax=Cyanophyceae TaxID=3028117 RepID=UPI00168690C1|nr:hypothetical protein [Coleofasciculus sp. FACHB-T130]MBD1879779.1 hypothetical protein [Coleofasciculus sp. FACHB-T130]